MHGINSFISRLICNLRLVIKSVMCIYALFIKADFSGMRSIYSKHRFFVRDLSKS